MRKNSKKNIGVEEMGIDEMEINLLFILTAGLVVNSFSWLSRFPLFVVASGAHQGLTPSQPSYTNTEESVVMLTLKY